MVMDRVYPKIRIRVPNAVGLGLSEMNREQRVAARREIHRRLKRIEDNLLTATDSASIRDGKKRIVELRKDLRNITNNLKEEC